MKINSRNKSEKVPNWPFGKKIDGDAIEAPKEDDFDPYLDYNWIEVDYGDEDAQKNNGMHQLNSITMKP